MKHSILQKLVAIACLLFSSFQSHANTLTFDDWTSTNTEHSSVSSNTYTFTTNGNTILSFDWLVSCEVDFDNLVITLDGTTILRKSGENSGTFNQELINGEHTLVVKYIKDESGSGGNDSAKVSNIKVYANPNVSSGFVIFDDWTSTNKSNSSTSSKTYTFTTNGEALLSFDWLVSSEAGYDELTVILDGTTILTKSGEYNGTHTTLVNSGEHTLIVKYSKDSEDKDGGDYAKVSNLTVKISEKSGILTFADWTSTNKSNKSTSSKTYTFKTTGNALLAFDWFISSETADKLIVSLDGTTILTKGGDLKGSFSQKISSGSHTIVFKYTKDSSDTEGEDYCMISNLLVESVLDLGACGENIFWKLYSDGDLIIYGQGEMTNYTSSTAVPWNSYKTSIQNITIEDGITSIGDDAFSGLSNLSSINIPNTVTYIGYGAFYNCSNLSDFNLPQNLISIGSYAFNNCDKITTFIIPEGVTSIGERAFQECNGISVLNIPKTVTSIGNFAFLNCTGEITINCSIKNNTYGVFKNANFSKVIIGEGVTSIGYNAFMDCDMLTSVELPQTINSIGTSVFKNCTSLESINLPDGIKSISSSLFYGCTNLSNITIPQNVTKIGSYAFNDCNSLTTINLPESVTKIEDGAFNGCKGLTSIIIPEGVTSIGSNAFGGCEKLTSINIPKQITKINNSVFANCYSLENVIIPNSVTSIGDMAFYDCEGLTSVTIPNSVTSIGSSAFYYCTSLTSITIPNSVTSIEDRAFCSCSGLTSITIDDGNMVYDSRGNCNAIIETNSNKLILGCSNTLIPNTVTSIGERAFYNCKNLTTLDIPESVNTIENSTFMFCSNLKDINIPNSITFIGSEAFYYCSKLTSINIPEGVDSIRSETFYSCSKLENVYLYTNPLIEIDAFAFSSKANLHLILNDETTKDFNISNANIFKDITFNCHIEQGKYATIILPFAPDAESLENFAFYTLSSIEGETIIFDEVLEPQANTPYLYKLRNGKTATQIKGEETTISSIIESTKISGWKMVGSFTHQIVDCTLGDGFYYSVNSEENILQNETTQLDLKPFTAYFKGTTENAIKLRIYTSDDELTNVEEIEIQDLLPVEYYNLNGAKVENPGKGIYIKKQGGKTTKVVL